jgi:hypothetical protein
MRRTGGARTHKFDVLDVLHYSKADPVGGDAVTSKAIAVRAEASERIHSALDQLLPKLSLEDIHRLAEIIGVLVKMPRVFVLVLTFVKTLTEEAPVKGFMSASVRRVMLAGKGHGERVGMQEGLRRLHPVTAPAEEWAESPLLGPDELSRQLKITRGTLHNWRRDHRVVALSKGIRNHVYPVRQFVGSKPVEGIAQLLEFFGKPDTVWEWLIATNAHTGGRPPIEWLREGKVTEVLEAASSELDFA